MNIKGTYTNIVEIGSGGGGTVFRAFHTRMQKYVVLKKIHDNLRSNVDIRGELNILKNLRHEFLPTVLDFIEDEDSIYTVMDYIPGESLESLLNKKVHFTQAQVVKYAAQLGQVLIYLHGQRTPIIHGDIKPANIMLTPEDNICLIDFNISQLQNAISSRNMGFTRGFASPEQTRLVQEMRQLDGVYPSARGGSTVFLNEEPPMGGSTVLLNEEPPIGGSTVLLDEELKTGGNSMLVDKQSQGIASLSLDRMDARSDIYSAGATLYALLSGQTPNADFSRIVPIEDLVEGCSEGLSYLIRKCMEIRPVNRFQTAEEFTRAVAGIAKVDKRYRHLVLRQTLAAIGCIIGIAGCAILAILGREQIVAEQVEAYDTLVEEMQTLRSEGGLREEQFEAFYSAAITEFPEYADAYYQKAAYLYEKRKYEELTKFISEEVLDYMGSFSNEETADFYFLLASGYFELDDLETALTYYRTAVKYNAHNSTYYSDYAIALARCGQLEEAEEVLEDAVNIGLTNDRVSLIQGEIAGRRGNLEDAARFFSQCIAETKDAYVLFRAYILWGKLYDEKQDEEGLLQKAEVLTKGLEEVDDPNRAVVLEQLTQAYIDLGKFTGNNSYNQQAIEYLQKIVAMGYDTYVTHNNIGILYEMLGSYEMAAQEFINMLGLYGEDYRTYKRLAFLEIEIQEEKENRNRDYSQFVTYYDRAKQLFADCNARADSDMEIQRLEQVYEQLEAGNWLD